MSLAAQLRCCALPATARRSSLIATPPIARARTAMLRLAHKYRQAAIYAYSCENGALMREVVWVDASKQASHGSKERMCVVAPPH